MLSRATSVGGTLWDRELDDDVPVALRIQIVTILETVEVLKEDFRSRRRGFGDLEMATI
jgi:hypothetical protein